MFDVKYFFYFTFLHLTFGTPQINLYYTNWTNASDNNGQQHDCLHIGADIQQENGTRRIMSYCLGVLSSKFKIENVNSFSNFTFAKLSKENITSQQLYLWSAPIDLIENYQFYLNQLSTTNYSILAEEIFYNCTMPRFGPMCQYELPYNSSHHSSLNEIIHEFYKYCGYGITNLTCYTHLQCNRGLYVSCLDWTEICDGHLNCLDNEFDEEHCWKLDINQCKDNEYQCNNGQCIPQAFYQDDVNVPDCIDGSDEYNYYPYTRREPTNFVNEPTFGSDDKTCDDIPLTSSCVHGRPDLLINAMLPINDGSLSDNCLSAFKCFLPPLRSFIASIYDKVCEDKYKPIQIVEEYCPDMFYFPTVPVLFDHIYFAYKKMDLRTLSDRAYVSPYVCYNNSLYDDYFVNASKILFNNTMCYQINHIRLIDIGVNDWYRYVASFYRDLWDYYQIWKYNRTRNYISPKCNRLDMYQCVNSLRCISKRFFVESFHLCPKGDHANRSEYDNIYEIDTLLDIPSRIDEAIKKQMRYARKHILFQTICDGYTELSLQNETDETECEQWECNNIYTHCDGIWNCFNGEDELNCNSSLSLNCPLNHHLCVSPHTNEFICLHINKANDGKVDCLGAADEPKLCRAKYPVIDNLRFYCMNQTFPSCILSNNLCNGHNECHAQGNDEQFCMKNRTLGSIVMRGICYDPNLPFATDIEKFLCRFTMNRKKEAIVYFSLDKISKTVEQQSNTIGNTVLPQLLPIYKGVCQYDRSCNRGLDLRVWLNDKSNLTNNTCLCPPNYYGSQCQYQNQRISLSIKFRAPFDSYQTPFAIVILLIDNSNERIIHSFEQFSYLSVRDCNIKFNIYLLYSTRPKDSNRNYSIHIDIYDKRSLTHRTSLFFPVNFSFLPVHRLAFLIDILSNDENSQSCSNHLCIHGKCIKYSNNLTFCQCERGWSGRDCTIQHICQCSSDSLCLGISAHNRSICICSLHKFGPRCLIDTICHSKNNSVCENGGQCIPNDDYILSNQKFTCICEKGFTGDRCQFADNKLTLSFSNDIITSQSISIHFIEVITNNVPVRRTILKTIPFQNDSIIIHWLRPFHLVFIEFFDKNYYLTLIQTTYNRSAIIIKTINSSDRCRNIDELLNKSIIQLELVRRIKYYHLPCQIYSPNLQCFYDDIHLCLCYNFGKKRLANCFEFQHNMKFDCFGQNECEHNGQCLQDDPKCPTSSMCICPLCSYGRKCQFSTNGSGLSLDAILGYHILPDVSLMNQPLITKMSITLTIIFFIAGLINSIVSLITFKNKSVCEVGCGLYLLGSSITSLLTMIMFGLKFLILLLTQMTIIENRSFLLFQCYSMDFILRVCLCMDQWLNACIAIERTMTAIKGTNFVKKKSKQAAKFTIIILVIVIIGTCIHDPLYRQLIDEENDEDHQKRTWCIIRYSSHLEVYNYIINIFHFVGPFLINLISSIILIIKQSRQQTTVHQQRSYKEHLREQCRQHKNLLTAPILLVILAIPRLIITFVSKCMKSPNDSWLFLVGYFISFIPPMLTSLIFIFPSKFYRKELRKTIAYYRTYIQRRLHLIS